MQHNILFLLISVSLIAGCAKHTEEDIPSYLAVDSISIKTTSQQGTASQKISDVWVYSDNELIGAFELPAQFPILKAGESAISLFAGIKMNGINETRVPYPFYDRLSKNLTLEREKIVDLGHLKFSYASATKFAWLESFEQGNITIDSTPRSEVNFVRVNLPELSVAFPYENNEYALKAVIPADSLVFECVSHEAFDLPTDGTSVFLELNYKSNNPFTVGLFANGLYSQQRSVLIVNPSSSWNKIYINFTPTLSANSDASTFKVFFSATKSTEDPQAEIYFDNIKVLHF